MLHALRNRLRQFRPSPLLVRLIPGSSRLFGPPRRWSSARRLSPGQARVHPLPIPRVSLVEPVWLGPPKTGWLGQPLPAPLPPAFVIEAREARVLEPDGTLVLADDTWVTDCGFYPWSETEDVIAFRYHHLPLRKKARPTRRLPGRTLVLAGDFTAHSYGHWLFDSITRWHLVEAAGYRPGDFERVYLPCPGPVARQLAHRLPFPPEKLILEAGACDLDCEQVVATNHPGWPGFVPAFAAHVLKDRLPAPLPPGTAPAPRIMIVRDGFRRNLANRAEIYPVLERHGFLLIDPRVTREVPAWCRQAEVIVSIEGSNAYDMLFARPGTKVLIITSPHHDTFPYPQSAAGAAGLRLYMLNASPTPGVPADSTSDFTLDPEEFARALALVLSAG
jgi:hypothetical protein